MEPKKKIQMNLFPKQKETHSKQKETEKQTYGQLPKEKDGGGIN